jgi:hypothetical protein
MSEPIKVGDVVMQVHSCCGAYLGRIFMVEHIRPGPGSIYWFVCGKCTAPRFQPVYAFTYGIAAAPLAWLKRIPPLSELEGVKTEEDIREPA